MARITAGVGSSHVPAIGAALDNGKTQEPYWQRVFSGFEKSKEWMKRSLPDVAIVVFNDHCHVVLGRYDPDIRARLRGGISHC